MLAILISLFSVVLISSLESYGRSYSEEISYYREEVRNSLVDQTFNALALRNEQLGLWPDDMEGLRKLSDLNLKGTGNYLLSDDPRNIHAPYLRFERSAERGSRYESDRAILITEARELHPEDSLLGGNQNACGDLPFEDGYSWCPPGVLNGDQAVLRSTTQQSLSLSVSEQEIYVRNLANRITNYINVNGSLPPTPGGADVPIYRHVRDGSGNAYDPNTPCDSAFRYNWDGIPLTCQDLFSLWHVENDAANTRDTLAEIYGVHGNSRFEVPVKAYHSGNTLTVYVETPFEYYGVSAWGTTTNKRGESRPSSGSPMYVYTTVSYNSPP